MKIKVYDGKQKLLISRTNVSAVDMVEVFRSHASIGDYTIEIEHIDETALVIGIHERQYTLTILTSEGEAYDCTSSEESLGEVDFVLGGQPIQWDRKYLVNKARVEATLEPFVHDWEDLVSESRWQMQV